MQSVRSLVQASPSLPGGVASHLLQPGLIRVPRDPGQTDAAALQMDEEQNVVGHQPAPREDLYREEVDPRQHGQMRLKEILPRRVLAAFRCRRDAMPLQDVPYTLIRDGITEVG